MTTITDPVATYFEAWEAGDPELLRPALADDVVFDGPLAHVEGADDYVSSLGGLFGATTGLTIRHRFDDGDDVVTWFDLEVDSGDPMPVANWTHLDGGLISRVRVTFDPRPMLG